MWLDIYDCTDKELDETRNKWPRFCFGALSAVSFSAMPSFVLFVSLSFDEAFGVSALRRIRDFFTAYAKKQGLSYV